MTAKKASTTKGTTFGDAEVVDDTVGEAIGVESRDAADFEATVDKLAAPEVNNGPENEAVTEDVEARKAGSWSEYEAQVREEFVGFLHGRKVEEAVRFVKKGWDARGGK